MLEEMIFKARVLGLYNLYKSERDQENFEEWLVNNKYIK